MSNMNEVIREELSRKLLEKKSKLFEGLETSDKKTLEEFFSTNDLDDYAWEEDLEEILYEAEDLEGDQLKMFSVGDIIMTSRFYSEQFGDYVDSPHRILIITSKKMSGDRIEYEGFLLSSNVDKSNKNNKRYPNNIHIEDYSSILRRGASSDKSAFINVADIVKFSNEDLSAKGTFKGKASYSFIKFIEKCHNNYKAGNSRYNARMYWRSAENYKSYKGSRSKEA